MFEGTAIVQTVSRWLLTAETRVRCQASICEICGGQSGTGRGFPLSVSFHKCSKHIHLPITQTVQS